MFRGMTPVFIAVILGFSRNLGSMVRKLVKNYLQIGQIGAITYNPLILTFDPNFRPGTSKYIFKDISPENWLEHPAFQDAIENG